MGERRDCDVLSLQQLAARYWARADGDLAQPLADLFTADAALVLGSLTLEGLPAIERFFQERDQTQVDARRTTRHIASNPLVTRLVDGRVRLRSTVMVYAGLGDWPLEIGTPSGIADFDDLCVHDSATGEWRFAHREGRTVFIGAGAAKFAR